MSLPMLHLNILPSAIPPNVSGANIGATAPMMEVRVP